MMQKNNFIKKISCWYVRKCINKKRSNKIFLMPPDPLTNFEIQKYYQNEPKFNGVC